MTFADIGGLAILALLAAAFVWPRSGDGED